MDIMKAESDADDEKVKVSGDSYCNWIDTKEEVDPLLMTFPSVKLESERDLDCVKAETDGDNETGMVSTNSYDDLIDIKEEMIPVVTFPAVTSESQKASCDSSETAELPSEEMTDEIHERREPEDLTVLAGTVALDHGGVRHAAQLIMMHPGYNPEDMYKNDIALVKLSSPITFNDQAQPVALPKQLEPTKGGTLATVIGWGLPYTDGAVMENLQHVNISVYDDEECQSIHSLEVHDTNICAGVPEGGKGQCSGDSGGPLIAGGHQVGIVSWSVKPCTVAPYPGVYTEVAHYVDWIRENSKDSC